MQDLLAFYHQERCGNLKKKMSGTLDAPFFHDPFLVFIVQKER
jgi:hypothetical protein